MKIFVLDSNIFDKIIEHEELQYKILVLRNNKKIKLLITSIQVYELNRIRDTLKKERIREWCCKNCDIVNSLGFLADISVAGDRVASEEELKKIGIGNAKHNKDAVTALTTESSADFIITDDSALGKRVKKQLPRVEWLNFENFLYQLLNS